MEWYLKVLKENYANFDGRARRKEYWMFTLFNVLIIFGLYALVGVGIAMESETLSFVFIGLAAIYALATIIPSIAVVVRRLHDQDKSGWYYFVGLIPLIGGIWILILMVTEGTVGDNQYGPDPKAGEH